MIIDLIPWSDTTHEGVSLHAELDFPHGTNRGQVVKLTAGGVYVHDGGYHHEDREATVTAYLRSKAQAEALEKLHTERVVIYFSDEFGTYKAQIKDLNVVSRPAIISLIILEKLILFQDMVYPPAPVPVDPWVDKTSDTYWTTFSGGFFTAVWTGSAWYFNGFGSFQFTPVGGGSGWNLDYAPSKVRFTFTSTGSTISEILFYASVSGGGSESLTDTFTSPASGVEQGPINYSGLAQLSSLTINVPDLGGLSLSKIEFYEAT